MGDQGHVPDHGHVGLGISSLAGSQWLFVGSHSTISTLAAANNIEESPTTTSLSIAQPRVRVIVHDRFCGGLVPGPGNPAESKEFAVYVVGYD